MQKLPTFNNEKELWDLAPKGDKNSTIIVAGVDEVGRGSFAGPVVTGCVIFKLNEELIENFELKNGKKIHKIEVNDSKKLTPKKIIKIINVLIIG